MICSSWRTIVIVVSFSLLARFALAKDEIAWTTPRTISTDADVSTQGTLFGAINNGGDGVQGVFVNNVPFSPFPTNGSSTQPVTHGNFTLYSDFSTVNGLTNTTGPSPTPGISGAYHALLASWSYNTTPSGLSVKISNLTVGQLYQVQLWANDSRGGNASPGTVEVGGSPSVHLKLNDTNMPGGRGQYALGTFTATASENLFSIQSDVSGPGDIAILTALQVRALPPGPPAQISNRGFYRGSLPGSADDNVLLFVHGNNSIAAYVASHNKFSSGGGRIAADGTFSFTMTLSGSSISGHVTADTISGSYTPPALPPESFNANRVDTASSTHAQGVVAGKYEGNLEGVGKLTLLIDPKGEFTLGGVDSTTNATIGGGGRVHFLEGENPSLANRAADWTPNDSEDASAPKFTGTFFDSPQGYENEIRDGSFNFHRSVIEGNIGGAKFRGTRQSAPNHFANISTRGTVTNGPRGQVIGGFIIQGGPKMVVIRAIGPSLQDVGVPDALSDPRVQVFSGQTLLGENDDWQTNSNSTELQAAFLAPKHAKESAVLIRLEPGAYTAVVTGTNNGTGVALVEVYELIRD